MPENLCAVPGPALKVAGRPPIEADREELTYSSYLRLPQLLDSQRPLAVPPVHDEFLFIIVHQVYELWFRLLLHELTGARDAMLGNDLHSARLLLERCRAAEQLMIDQMGLLDTLSPVAFLRFRSALGQASGMQSAQFREIEFLSGRKDERNLRTLTAAEHLRLRGRLNEPSLWDAFLDAVAAAGLPVGGEQQRGESLLVIARAGQPYRELWGLAERLIDHDQAWSLWRSRHVLLVERQVGARMGTGGSPGAQYLRSREPQRFYPELWDVRGRL